MQDKTKKDFFKLKTYTAHNLEDAVKCWYEKKGKKFTPPHR